MGKYMQGSRIVRLMNGDPEAVMEYPEFHKLYNNISETRFRHVFTLLYFTGLRPEELRDITTSHIYRSKRMKKSVVVAIPTAKTESNKLRHVPMPFKYPEVRDLWEWSQKMPPQFYIAPVKLKADIRHWITYRFKKYGITETVEISGKKVVKPLPPYFFRHNFATLLGMRGFSIAKIAQARGTSEIVTMKHYRHITPANLDDIIEAW